MKLSEYLIVPAGRKSYHMKISKPASIVAIDAESKCPGDFSNDGSLDARDVTSLMRELITTQTTPGYKSDFNGDGKVNALDAVAILKAIAAEAAKK